MNRGRAGLLSAAAVLAGAAILIGSSSGSIFDGTTDAARSAASRDTGPLFPSWQPVVDAGGRLVFDRNGDLIYGPGGVSLIDLDELERIGIEQGTDPVEYPPGEDPPEDAAPDLAEDESDADAADEDSADDSDDQESELSWSRTVATVLGVALLVALIVGLIYATARQLRSRMAGAGDDAQDEASPEPLDRLIDASSQDQQRWAMTTDDPRAAVVACWMALETAAARGGLPRAVSQTSMEFTGRVLSAWAVPAPVVSRLGELFREARFSQHPVTEEMRTEAVQALRTVNETLLNHRAGQTSSRDQTAPLAQHGWQR